MGKGSESESESESGSGNMFYIILCCHRVWNPNPSPNLNLSLAVEMSDDVYSKTLQKTDISRNRKLK